LGNDHAESDAALIAAATAENLRKHNLDPNSQEGKAMKRKVRNRMSAALHRERKKAYIDELEGIIDEKDSQIEALTRELEAVKAENNFLRSKHQLPGDIYSAVHVSIATDVESPLSSKLHSAATSDVGDDSDQYSSDTASVGTGPRTGIEARASTGRKAGGSSSGSGNTGSDTGGGLIRFMKTGITFLSVIAMVSINLLQSPGGIKLSSMGGEHFVSKSANAAKMLPMPGVESGAHNESPFPVVQKFGRGRVLLSTEDADPLVVFDQEEDYGPNAVPIRDPILSTQSALWKYQDRVVTLFPRGTSRATDPGLARANVSVVNNGPGPRRKFLRQGSQAQGGAEYAHLKPERHERSEVVGREIVPVMSTQKALVPAMAGQATSDGSGSTSGSLGGDPTIVRSMSRVLMTHGQAHLDPALTIGSATVDMSDKRGGHRATSPRAADAPAGTLSSSLQSVVTGISTWMAPAPKPPIVFDDASMHTTPAGSNMLLMLLPASSVHWGANSSMETILNGLNLTTNGEYVNSDGAGNGFGWDASAMSSMYVEIGCSVFRAQLVRNVTML
jgi:bZIP transcription factor